MHSKHIVSLVLLIMVIATLPVSIAQEDVDVLFDLSKEHDATYGNPIVQSDRLCSSLADDGITYGFIEEDETLSLASLVRARILVIWDPDEMYSSEEMEAVRAFVEQGGVLIFAGTSFFDTPSMVFDNINELLDPFGIQMVHERVIDRTNFVGCHCGTTPVATVFAPDSYFYNIEEIALSHSCYLEVEENVTVLVKGDDDAFVDKNNNEVHDEDEPQGDIPLIAQTVYGEGKVIVLPTEKTFERISIGRKDNMKFAVNLFGDLVSGSRPTEESSIPIPYVVAGIAVIAVCGGAVVIFMRRHQK
ncbi:hypothetical protein EF808_04205 [archaeon]|nr:MAG: hypothetical protein EF808_04205 [archaeon]